MAARVGLKLHRITEEPRCQARALGILQALQAQARQHPWGFAHLLTVQALNLIPPVDLTLVGDPGDPRTQALLQTVYRDFLPERRLLLKNPAAPAALEALAPAARAYSSPDGAPVAYLCHHFTCLPGLSDPRELAAELEKVGGRAGEAAVP